MPAYVERFTLPIEMEDYLIDRASHRNGGGLPYIDNVYPCRVFPQKELSEIWLKPITILYGGNGSGKSTLLNLMAAKLGLGRISPHNTGEVFDLYVQACDYALGEDDDGERYTLPEGSEIVTSDDVFDYMLTMRTNNDAITDGKEEAKAAYAKLKYGESVRLRGMEDYEALRMQVHARSRSVSRRRFIRETAGSETALQSNGETALSYFNRRLCSDTFYCLDEPENSMSPRMQMKLAELLEDLARHCGCQLVIATHSPFLLAMEGARIYDLDAQPAQIANWWELENTRTYYDFFRRHSDKFGGRL